MSDPNRIIKHFLKSKQLDKRFVEWLFMPFSEQQKEQSMQDHWDSCPSDADSSTVESYNKLASKLNIDKKGRIDAPVHRLRRRVDIRLIAASIILPLLLSCAIYFYLSKEDIIERKIAFNECFAPLAGVERITLSDSSVVMLNSGSVLIYPQSFDSECREVFLTGEASFDVKPDNNRQFIVKTADMRVLVLGTVFNISSYADSRECSATTKSGKVLVELQAGGGESYTLTADQQMIYDRVSGESRKIDVKAADSFLWEAGGLVFNSASIDEIIKTIERRYNAKVYLSTSKFENACITAKFIDKEPLDNFMSILGELLPGFRYKIENSNVYIY